MPQSNNPSLCFECPHCHHDLTMKEVINVLRGDCNFPKIARVLLRDGRVALVEAGQVFPMLGEVLNDDWKGEVKEYVNLLGHPA